MTERSTLQVALAQQMSFRAIAKLLKRAPSTISRKVRHHARFRQQYQANKTQDNRH
uniref:helix-turn-helix domain-containing protein n=1 Tax=Zymobacter palmae TaxID=33074 RepID=UPI0039879F19